MHGLNDQATKGTLQGRAWHRRARARRRGGERGGAQRGRYRWLNGWPFDPFPRRARFFNGGHGKGDKRREVGDALLKARERFKVFPDATGVRGGEGGALYPLFARRSGGLCGVSLRFVLPHPFKARRHLNGAPSGLGCLYSDRGGLDGEAERVIRRKAL